VYRAIQAFGYIEAADELYDFWHIIFRFYFIGDDDLLEILGQPSNPAVIQAHLKKLYAGIHSVTLDNGKITVARSVEGEAVALVGGVALSDVVEKWLSRITVEVQAALQGLLRMELNGSDEKRWSKQPSQVLGLAQELAFTEVLLDDHSCRYR
jgi:dynein heavy chain 2, cytosolic